MFNFTDTKLLRPKEPFPYDKNLYIYYDAEWEIEEPPQKAEMYFWASGLAEIACNGVCIHQGPCRDSLPLLYYDVVPLTNLTAGKNRIDIKLNIEELKKTEDFTGNLCEFAGILLELQLDDKRISKENLNIKAAYFKDYLSDVPKNSGAGYSEVVTLSKEGNWFCDNSCFKLQDVISAFYLAPDMLNERCIPLFKENKVLPKSFKVEENGSILFDFEEMVFGRVEISATAFKEVVIGYIEDLEHGWSNAEGNQEMYQDRVIGANGNFRFKSFRKRAFRYIRLYNVSNDDITLTVHEYGYPTNQIGSFNCSDDFLNRLMKISTATLRINVDDIYNDCPHRDQSQWMDAYLSSKIMLALYGDTALARKCLYQHAIGSFHNGTICSPSINGAVMFADYALIFFDYVMWYYKVTGDQKVLEDLFGNLKQVLEYFYKQVDETELVKSVSALGLVYLDNTFELSRTPHSAALNALYYMAMMHFSNICDILEFCDESKKWKLRAKNLQNKFFQLFENPLVPNCLKDSDTPFTDGYYMVNFSCEFGRWHSKGAMLEFCINSETDKNLELYVAEYAGFRVFCNGELCVNEIHNASWDRQPCYDPIKIIIPLQAGVNHIRWEVCANQLNFELFFRSINNEEINFYSPVSKQMGYALVKEFDFKNNCSIQGAETFEIRVRKWVMPLLSQSTHMYACISGIYKDSNSARDALERIMPDEFIRTYISVRVPYFCQEAGEKCETKNWVMPVNTPWTGSFLLQALGKYDRADLGLSVLRRFWGGMIEQGAVNTWEEWGNRSSLCHAWGATPAYFMLNQILGVEHILDNDGAILIRPNLFDLEWAEGSVAVGVNNLSIFVSLKKENNKTKVCIKVPSGVNYKIDLSRLENPIILVENQIGGTDK